MPSGEVVKEVFPEAMAKRAARNWPFEDMDVGECRRFVLGEFTDHNMNQVTRDALWYALRKVKELTEMDFTTEKRLVGGKRFIYVWRTD